MIIKKDNLIFVHIQKTGGSAINVALGCERFPPHMHRTALELRNIYGEDVWDTCHKFAFVRNPWDRLVSWWSMIDAKRSKIITHGTHNKFFTYVVENADNFTEFLLHCQDEIEDEDGTKCIFRNQLDYMTDDFNNVIIDYVGRFERLAQDFSVVTTKVYGTARALPLVNASEHKNYRHYYTNETQHLIQRAYARDIAHFGFTF